MFDCGEGTQLQILKADLVKLSKISFIFVTHLHGDHIFGLPGLIASMCLLCPGREPLTVFGPTGIEKFIRTALEASETYLTYTLNINELVPGKTHDLGLLDGSSSVLCVPITHKVPCFGYIVKEPDRPGNLDAKKAASLGAKGKELGVLKSGNPVTLPNGTVIKPEDVIGPSQPGKKVVILGDTCDASGTLAPGAGCDILVHECTLDNTIAVEMAVDHGHSTSTMAGLFGKAMGAKKMILTHFSMRYATGEGGKTVADLVTEAQSQCPGTQVLAADDLAAYSL